MILEFLGTARKRIASAATETEHSENENFPHSYM
jgi:hypothetical protein